MGSPSLSTIFLLSVSIVTSSATPTARQLLANNRTTDLAEISATDNSYSLSTLDTSPVPVSVRSIHISGHVMTGERCDQQLTASSTFTLEYDCPSSTSGKSQSLLVTTNADGSFDVLVILNFIDGSPKDRSACSLRLCDERRALGCSAEEIVDPMEAHNVNDRQLGAASRPAVSFCLRDRPVPRSRERRGEPLRERRWSEQDMSWMKRNAIPSGFYRDSKRQATARKPTKQGDAFSSARNAMGNGLLLNGDAKKQVQLRGKSEAAREKRLWEGAEDEVGWIKRADSGQEGLQGVRAGETKAPPCVNLESDGLCDYALMGEAEGPARAGRETAQDGRVVWNDGRYNAGTGGPRARQAERKRDAWKESDIAWL